MKKTKQYLDEANKENFDEYTITLRVTNQGMDELLPLLKELKTLGDVGASRGIKIEDWDGRADFGFDGDGNAKIKKIEVEGVNSNN